MATCPRCRGPLTDTHVCPRRPGRTALQIGLAAVAGGIVGLIAVALFDPQGKFVHLDGVALIVGGLLAVGIDRLARGWRPGA